MTADVFRQLMAGDQCISFQRVCFLEPGDLRKYIGEIFVCEGDKPVSSSIIEGNYIRGFRLLEDARIEFNLYNDEVELCQSYAFNISDDEAFSKLFSDMR